MKCTLRCFLAISIFLQSCETTFPVSTEKATVLREDIVMPVHDRPLDVFYLQESLNKKPVTELALIDLNYDSYVSDSYLLHEARRQARDVGADGIYVLSREEYMRYEKSTLSDIPQVNRTTFRAIAFVYDENLKDTVRVYATKLLVEQERLKPKFVVKSRAKQAINLHTSEQISAENVARQVMDFEPIELLERTGVVLYNEKRTLQTHVFKVRYQGEELYLSGFDVVQKL